MKKIKHINNGTWKEGTRNSKGVTGDRGAKALIKKINKNKKI
ncbi:hypothetical protein ACSXC4_13820 [Clostridium perfringens]|nr:MULTISPECIES: hypothetical protein [Clostridium]MDK7590534.1 hypothetical protein [Clostridium sp. UMB9555B]